LPGQYAKVIPVLQDWRKKDMQPIAGEIVVTVTSNVIKITAVIMVGYAVMEVIRGLINMSTWLFELPMPAVFMTDAVNSFEFAWAADSTVATPREMIIKDFKAYKLPVTSKLYYIQDDFSETLQV
jgi:hypothetical protein